MKHVATEEPDDVWRHLFLPCRPVAVELVCLHYVACGVVHDTAPVVDEPPWGEYEGHTNRWARVDEIFSCGRRETLYFGHMIR